MSATVPTPTGYLTLACFTWLIYDYLITLDDEIELIWRRKWSFTKAIFLLLRWSTFCLLLIEVIFYVFLQGIDKCDAFSWGTAIATFIVVLEVEIVLQLRIYVMFRRSKRILWINAALCALEMICAGVIVAKYYSEAHYVAVPDWILGSCYDVRPKVVATVWVAPLLYELYLALLAMYKVIHDHRAIGMLVENSILTVLARDSVGYFFLIVVVVAVNIVLYIETVVTPGDSAVNLIHAAGAIGGARLILSMRDAALRPGTLPTQGTAGSMHFQMKTRTAERQRETLSSQTVTGADA